MRLGKAEVPQANNFSKILQVPFIVADGGRTYQDISRGIGMVERQGRYYRLAAELLGFIQRTDRKNEAALTPLGRQLIRSEDTARKDLVRRAVVNAKAIQRVIPFFESHPEGVTQTQLKDFIDTVAVPAGPSMIPRRESSVRAWLASVDLLRKEDNRFFLNNSSGLNLPVIQYADEQEPLLMPKAEWKQYEKVSVLASAEAKTIMAAIDQAAKERANNSHKTLVNLIADKLTARGAIPRCNKYVDLAATIEGQNFLLEAKSTTKGNFHSQVRAGISQLYEYRYFQQIPDAKLILVTETPAPTERRWLIQYLVNDRNIYPVWDGSGDRLFCPPELKSELSFLVA